EIHSQFGYMLGKYPVFGPGAKTVVSFVGTEISEEMNFWRKPEKQVSTLEIISPVTALNLLSKDKRFINVAKLSKDKNFLSNGRFYDDVELGYYALSPMLSQKFYVPVYKIRGTFESRINLNFKNIHLSGSNQDTFRYDFENYVLALHGNAKGLGLNQFKHNIIW
ncbi:MAG: hypothetical protein JNJ57_15990, partial [Saprospiraceae bacterium]|nr:hypothetical protein [Saprospiraceae bacterium]